MQATLLSSRVNPLRLCAVPLAYLASAMLALGAGYEWNFSANLNPSLGNGQLQYADPTSQALTTFGTTDGAAVPHINGAPATYMRVPAFTAVNQGYLLTLTDTAPNGGGVYVNQYTIIIDLLSPGSIDWTPFFNTAPDNSNDADFYLAQDGSIGIGTLGYSSVGLIVADTWYRIAFVADLGSGNVSYYLNGNVVHARVGGSLLDGRFSLYSNVDPGADVLLANEGDASGQYTHQLLVNSLYFSDTVFSPAQMAALGGPNAAGIVVPEPGTWTLLGLGLLALTRPWRRAKS